MDYDILLDLATDLGYRLAMSGAETFRVEDSICHIMRAYGIEGEAFAIPNCLTVSVKTADGKPLTRMRRIGYHGNDLDCVERYSNLSRRICAELPSPETALEWLRKIEKTPRSYGTIVTLLGNFLGAGGFAILFGSTFWDSLLSGLCGLIVGTMGIFTDKLKANLFFRTIIASFLMALAAYFAAGWQIADNADTIIIGALMILVPGLLFTNAIRDIIHGDTNSGINRIVQVLLIAAAIALGTAAAWKIVTGILGTPVSLPELTHHPVIQLLGAAVAGIGFSLIFNIHGPGILICAAGGVLTWGVYLITCTLSGNDILGYFIASLVASLYSELMARIRKYPAISYLVVSIFPLIPGASVYYTVNHAVRGEMESFTSRGMHTLAIAGAIAVGILLISTVFRLWAVWKQNRKN